MEEKVINGIEMVDAEYLRWDIHEEDRNSWGDYLALRDTETWISTLKKVWGLERKKDYDYYDERPKYAKKDVRHYFVSVDIALRIASLYKDDYLYRDLMGEIIEEE